jgi:hypothetical protein
MRTCVGAIALPLPSPPRANYADGDQHNDQQRQFDKRGELNRIVEHDGTPPDGPFILRHRSYDGVRSVTVTVSEPRRMNHAAWTDGANGGDRASAGGKTLQDRTPCVLPRYTNRAG